MVYKIEKQSDDVLVTKIFKKICIDSAICLMLVGGLWSDKDFISQITMSYMYAQTKWSKTSGEKVD